MPDHICFHVHLVHHITVCTINLPCSITCWVGADERPEFVRQSDLLANIWTGLGAVTATVHAKGKHHFNVIEGLEDADSPLTRCFITRGFTKGEY